MSTLEIKILIVYLTAKTTKSRIICIFKLISNITKNFALLLSHSHTVNCEIWRQTSHSLSRKPSAFPALHSASGRPPKWTYSLSEIDKYVIILVDSNYINVNNIDIITQSECRAVNNLKRNVILFFLVNVKQSVD